MMGQMYLSLCLSVIRLWLVASNSTIGQTCFNVEPNRHCMSLYGDKSSQVTWHEALDMCSHQGLRLAVLSSRSLIDGVRNLVTGSSLLHVNSHVWIAGMRREDQEWYRLNGTTLETGQPEYVWGNFCGCYRISDRTVIPCDCYTRDKYHGICSYPPNADHECEGGYPSDGKCYDINSGNVNWFEAVTNCTSAGRTIVSSTDIISLDLSSIGVSKLEYIWVALTVNPWTWITDRNGLPVVITTYNWLNGEGDDMTGDNPKCIHLEPNQGGKWSDKPCNVTSNYFMCENVSAIPVLPPDRTTVVPLPGPTPPIRESNTDSTTGDSSVAGTASSVTPTVRTEAATEQPITGKELGFNLVYIAPLVVGIIFVLIAVVMGIIFLRRRRRNKLHKSASNTAPESLENQLNITREARTISDQHGVYELAGPIDTQQPIPVSDNTVPSRPGYGPGTSQHNILENTENGIAASTTHPAVTSRESKSGDTEDVFIDNLTYGSL